MAVCFRGFIGLIGLIGLISFGTWCFVREEGKTGETGEGGETGVFWNLVLVIWCFLYVETNLDVNIFRCSAPDQLLFNTCLL